jgi:hypothetical protein
LHFGLEGEASTDISGTHLLSPDGSVRGLTFGDIVGEGVSVVNHGIWLDQDGQVRNWSSVSSSAIPYTFVSENATVRLYDDGGVEYVASDPEKASEFVGSLPTSSGWRGVSEFSRICLWSETVGACFDQDGPVAIPKEIERSGARYYAWTAGMCSLSDQGRIRCTDKLAQGAPAGFGWQSIASLYEMACAIHEDETLFCWGEDVYGLTEPERGLGP